MTKKTNPLALSLIAYQGSDSHQPFGNLWHAESQEFKYLHPVNGQEYKTSISAGGSTKAEVLAKAQAQLDTFMADRGNTVFEVIPFTADQLSRAKA